MTLKGIHRSKPSSSTKRNMFRLSIVVCLLSVLPQAWGQVKTNKAVPGHEFAVFGTVTFADNDFYAKAFDRRLSILGLQYRHFLLGNSSFHLSYAPEIMPVALLAQPSFHGFVLPTSVPPLTSNEITYGAGANPIGIELLLLPKRRIQPYVANTEGFLYFTKNVPSRAAAQFNFAASGRVGTRLKLGDRTLSVAYVFHHFSNAFEAQDNPGVDSQMLYFGYDFNFKFKSTDLRRADFHKPVR